MKPDLWRGGIQIGVDKDNRSFSHLMPLGPLLDWVQEQINTQPGIYKTSLLRVKAQE